MANHVATTSRRGMAVTEAPRHANRRYIADHVTLRHRTAASAAFVAFGAVGTWGGSSTNCHSEHSALRKESSISLAPHFRELHEGLHEGLHMNSSIESSLKIDAIGLHD